MRKKSTSITFVRFGHALQRPTLFWVACFGNVLTALSSSDMESLWDFSHIDKRSAPPMPYKLELKAWVYHYYTGASPHGFILMPWAQAYKAWEGRFSCRYGITLKVFPCVVVVHSCLEGMGGALLLSMWDCTQSLPMSLKNKTLWACPKADKLLMWAWNKNPPHKPVYKQVNNWD